MEPYHVEQQVHLSEEVKTVFSKPQLKEAGMESRRNADWKYFQLHILYLDLLQETGKSQISNE